MLHPYISKILLFLIILILLTMLENPKSCLVRSKYMTIATPGTNSFLVILNFEEN